MQRGVACEVGGIDIRFGLKQLFYDAFVPRECCSMQRRVGHQIARPDRQRIRSNEHFRHCTEAHERGFVQRRVTTGVCYHWVYTGMQAFLNNGQGPHLCCLKQPNAVELPVRPHCTSKQSAMCIALR